MNPTVNAQPAPIKRVIGPIPPRAKDGTLRAKDAPDLTNLAGLRAEEICQRKLDARVYVQGQEADPEAIKGLQVFEVDLESEPILRVYARSEAEAVEVYKKEWGVKRFGENDPKIRKVG